ncbi:Septin-1 [Eumeta japonica]|uniref:Septin-1 n=1 Tax=Eumeta variegata TaxID=151549 RepID=A0A4C1VLB3_EUMVA|nr:Septin-1 [Eumeta japonica]
MAATGCRVAMTGHSTLVIVFVYLPASKQFLRSDLEALLVLGDAVIFFGDTNCKNPKWSCSVANYSGNKLERLEDKLGFKIIDLFTSSYYLGVFSNRLSKLDIAVIKGVALNKDTSLYLKSSYDSICLNGVEIVECLAHSIKSQRSQASPPHDILRIHSIEEKVRHKASLESKDDLSPVSVSEVQRLIKSFKTGKAPCLDNNSDKFSNLETPGYVGFANLPNQVHRKSVKKGFEFTLMVVGESGLGKSTLVNSLFLTDLYPERVIPDAAEKTNQTVKLDASTVEIEERGVKLRLTVVDTPGYGDAIDNTDCFKNAMTSLADKQADLAVITKLKYRWSSRESYGDDAVGYVQLKRESNICTVKCRVCPEHKVRSKPYTVTIIVDEKNSVIISSQCHDCAASAGGCKHAVAFLMWLHRRSEEPSCTQVQCYWKKSELSKIMAPRKKLTREEKLQKKREAERQRYQKIKNDPEKYKLQKQKKKKIFEKEEKGLIKTVDQMTPREQRKARKIWKKKAKERRQRLALQNVTNIPAVPSTSDVDDQLPQRIFLTKALAAKLKSDRARRQRYLMIKKKKDETINKLKAKVACYKKRLQRLRKREKHTPNSKVEEVMNSPCARETVKKKLLFAEVLHQQLKENYSALPNEKEKRIFKRVISGKLVRKYGILQNEKNIKPLRKIGKVQLIDDKRKAKEGYEIMKRKIINFLEDDSNTRLCAGKRDYVTKKGDRRQKKSPVGYFEKSSQFVHDEVQYYDLVFIILSFKTILDCTTEL